jgi:hypothetical protein
MDEMNAGQSYRSSNAGKMTGFGVRFFLYVFGNWRLDNIR